MFMIVLFQMFAQVDHDYNPNDKEPIAVYNLSDDQVPITVAKEIDKDFNRKKAEGWSKFPYTLKEYGWVYDSIGTYNVNPDRYVAKIIINNGHDLYAVYDAKGFLIATREISENMPMPPSVQERLANSTYSDWNLVGNKEIIRFYYDRKNVEQHFRITVEKDGVKRSISFNFQPPSIKDEGVVQTEE